MTAGIHDHRCVHCGKRPSEIGVSPCDGGRSDFDGGVREGLQRAIDLLRTHQETTSNQEPFRYLAHRKWPDLTNMAFIERLEEMRDAL